MSDKRYTPHCGGSGGDSAQINEHLSKKTLDELVDELAETWDAMTEENFDPQLIDAYLTALDERDSMAIDYNAEASLVTFLAKHSNIINQIEPVVKTSHKTSLARPIHRPWRMVRLVATIIAVVVGCMITAQALGIDIFGAIARWTDETFHFDTNTKNNQIISGSADLEYSNLKMALDEYGITEMIAPNWYPSDFYLSSIKVTPTPKSIKIQAAYEGRDKFLAVTVWQYESAEEASGGVFEKDRQDVEIYEQNSVAHYIMSNNGQMTSAWTTNNLKCSISGDLSKNEIKRMIDSIYER